MMIIDAMHVALPTFFLPNHATNTIEFRRAHALLFPFISLSRSIHIVILIVTTVIGTHNISLQICFPMGDINQPCLKAICGLLYVCMYSPNFLGDTRSALQL